MDKDIQVIGPETGTALIRVNPLTDAAVTRLRDEALKFKAHAELTIVDSKESQLNAINDLALIANTKKLMEEAKKEYTRPIQDHLAQVRGDFDAIMTPLLEADRILRDKDKAYRAEMQKKADEAKEINDLREEAARREAAMNGGEISQPVNLVIEPPAPAKTVHSDIGAVSSVKTRHYRVVDFAKLPDQYKMENVVLLNKVTKAGIPEIPGVEFFFEESLRINTK